MSFSAKKFLQQYGTAGVISYAGVTAVSIASIYVGLRSGVDIILPLEKCLGADSEFVQNVKAKLGEAPPTTIEQDGHSVGNINQNGNSINWVREGTYLGIAGALDSLVLPLKLMISLPMARQLLKIRGRRRP
mmetsp:Transcript_35/g.58  ORF Transcript_35/g.58 Transcript_35/m.58 type:complete len:132 (-) Transcript_35:391-786(-)|eukprot:CAMPEP_0172368126 /NCGR_PEP_ID=MMETSP1060-20121228/25322_1 /TAXON_ID=37318 /ORGANISM="Pseudo-nitzschia pungens, Strain cf. cingulata" /LENGTH=131 /DNA_ID=CAMNT_0013092611 /DNA_START=101 /DNA_END=496 /DNA_ORIENTATION=+